MTKRTPPYSPEVRERAVRMVLDHQGEHASQAARSARLPPRSAARRRPCAAGFARPSAIRAGGPARPRTSASASEALERENRELRQANEILRKASAYFAMAELDRRSKP